MAPRKARAAAAPVNIMPPGRIDYAKLRSQPGNAGSSTRTARSKHLDRTHHRSLALPLIRTNLTCSICQFWFLITVIGSQTRLQACRASVDGRSQVEANISTLIVEAARDGIVDLNGFAHSKYNVGESRQRDNSHSLPEQYLNMKKLDCSAIAVGARIGRLTIDAVERSSNGFKVITTCDCGNSFVTPRSLLLFGVQSCGCLFADRAEMNERIRRGQPPQGCYNGLASQNPAEYGTWLKMLQRCSDPQSVGYHNYGGRGITVCQRWQESFEAFFIDMGQRPPGRSIERRCNDQGYSPDNCYWATRAEQSRNTRRNRRITFDGRTLIITDWAKEIGIHHASLRQRLKTWPLEKALTSPPRRLDPRLGRRHRHAR